MKAHLNLTFIIANLAAASLLTNCSGTDVVNQRGADNRQSANQTAKSSSIPATTQRSVSVATVDVPVAGDEVDPTKGDIVAGLENKVSCYQQANDLCVMMQTDRSDVSSMEKLCENSDSDAGLQEGNICADLDITAKCNIEIKGDRFTIYNIGGLSTAKESALAKECAGVKVDGKVFKGTFVTVTDEYTQNLELLDGGFLDILKKIFEGIFGFLIKIFQK